MQRKDRWQCRGRLWWSLCSILLLAGCQSLPTGKALQRDHPVDQEPLTEHVVQRQAMPGSSGYGPLMKHPRRHRTSLAEEIIHQPSLTSDQPIPICLDTVLQMAQDHNGQIRLARLKVDEAFSDQELASKHWLPDLSIGMGTWRHEGGIQDFQGNLLSSSYGSAFAGLDLRGKYDWKETLFRRVEAERKYWQNKGELSKLTSENLLEASSTYIDLLSARTGVAVSLETEIRLGDLMKQASDLAKIDPGVRVEVSRIHAELIAQNVLTVKLRAASKAASAKLAYLLGLDPRCEMVTVDRQMVPIKLMDVSLPVSVLVEQAFNHGPGIRELEGLLRTVEAARGSNYGWQHWVPAIELCLQEGAFAAGPGRQLDWANRYDMEVYLRWNLNEFVYAKQKRQQADMHIRQVQLSYQDLRLKLTLGVQEARDAILGGIEQVRLAEDHITYAEESFKLSEQRLKQNIKGRSPSEVLLALRSLGGARLEYLQAVRDLDKAQLRLFALVGSHEAACQR